jgi:hypothetical protein
MNSNISNLLAKKYAVPTLCGAAVLATGFTAVYISRRISKKNEIVVPAEEVTMQDSFTIDPQDLEMLVPIEDLMEEEIDNTPESVNVFMSETDDYWDYEHELSIRDPENPYVIHADEYINDEMGFRQSTVTYYAGDDILADMSDTPVYNWNFIMGPLEWGHGSKDKNVVYIRNERLRKEWEVLLHSGSYEIEVAGFQMEKTSGELQHSLRKFRDD